MILRPRPDSHTPDKIGRADEPWLTRGAITFLELWLQRSFRVLEYGVGASTVWYAARAMEVLGVEHDKEWAEEVQHCLYNGVIHFVPLGEDSKEYCEMIETLGIFDLIVIDGRCRVEIARRSRAHVRVGGLVVLDNADRPSYRAIPELYKGWKRTIFSNDIDQTDVYERLE